MTTQLLTPLRAAALAACLLAGATPALAGSSASSASSEGSSASVGSLSTSITASSNSSSPTTTAEGDYRVIEVAALPDRPGDLRLRLQPVAARGADEGFFLNLPRAAFELSGVAEGEVVSARARPYGLEFARAATREAFFLVLADEWYRELQTRPVAL
jgi:hypothetical protein